MKKLIDVWGLRDITDERIIEMYENEDKYYRLMERTKELERHNEALKSEYISGGKKIRELIVSNQALSKELKKHKRKSKKKYRDMKLEYVSEILLLKSKLYDNYNIYEVKKEMPQNVVKIR